MYYIFIQANKINGCGQCKQLTEGVERAIYKDKGIDFEDIIELVKCNRKYPWL